MKAKTVVYGAYFALKLWIWRVYTKSKKKKGNDNIRLSN